MESSKRHTSKSKESLGKLNQQIHLTNNSSKTKVKQEGNPNSSDDGMEGDSEELTIKKNESLT